MGAITNNFSLEELIFSDYAIRNNIDNTPPPDVLFNLKYLAVRLEQCRIAIGLPIRITSGYRCKELNDGVNGASNSAHTYGLAADINVPGMSALKVTQELIPFIKYIKIDQLIYEGTWTHIGLCLGRTPREQVLRAVFSAGGVSYINFTT